MSTFQTWAVGFLLFALLVWGIVMSVLYAKCREQNTQVPTSITASTTETTFSPGLLMRNGEYVFVLQTDGNLAIYKKNTVISETKNQTFQMGTLSYNADSKATVLEFSGKPQTTENTASFTWEADPAGAQTLTLNNDGTLSIVSSKGKVTKIDLKDLVIQG